MREWASVTGTACLRLAVEEEEEGLVWLTIPEVLVAPFPRREVGMKLPCR